ncbi:TetR family transcriptional regulator [Companilactobacillus crustorum]|nr:TetR/AcrR family transcriptional regulator [Companilactobacillus crustorum]GEO77006.1 TetR family transcriptional regulator [Companilactobacillus crustorum]
MNTNDRRARRTQKLIRNNFIDLMAVMPIEDITIQKITDKADINRRTFYLHYRDIYDLLHKTEDYVMNHFSKILEEFEPTDEENNIGSQFFKVVMSYIEANQKMIGVLCRNPDSELMQKLIQLTVANGQRVIPFSNSEEAEYILNYCCWGMVGVLRTAMRKQNFDITKLSDLANRLLVSTIESDEQ